MMLETILQSHGIYKRKIKNFLYGVVPNQSEYYTFWCTNKGDMLSSVSSSDLSWFDLNLIDVIKLAISKYMSNFADMPYEQKRWIARDIREAKRLLSLIEDKCVNQIEIGCQAKINNTGYMHSSLQ